MSCVCFKVPTANALPTPPAFPACITPYFTLCGSWAKMSLTPVIYIIQLLFLIQRFSNSGARPFGGRDVMLNRTRMTPVSN